MEKMTSLSVIRFRQKSFYLMGISMVFVLAFGSSQSAMAQDDESLLYDAEREISSVQDPQGFATGSMDKPKNEVVLDLLGVKSFSQVSDFKKRVKKAIPGRTVIQEKRVSRGKVSFALKTHLSFDEVKAQIYNISTDDLKLTVMGSGDDRITMEIQ